MTPYSFNCFFQCRWETAQLENEITTTWSIRVFDNDGAICADDFRNKFRDTPWLKHDTGSTEFRKSAHPMQYVEYSPLCEKQWDISKRSEEQGNVRDATKCKFKLFHVLYETCIVSKPDKNITARKRSVRIREWRYRVIRWYINGNI